MARPVAARFRLSSAGAARTLAGVKAKARKFLCSDGTVDEEIGGSILRDLLAIGA
jgi:hypothetical protein